MTSYFYTDVGFEPAIKSCGLNRYAHICRFSSGIKPLGFPQLLYKDKHYTWDILC